MQHNALLQTDGYKLTHWRQYPKDTEIVYSYLESRGGMFKRTIQVGLQYYLKEYLAGQYFTQHDIMEAETLAAQYFGNPELFNRKGWEYILARHQGRLPLRIRAIPEGHAVDTHNALVTIENTDPNVPWLTNYVESLLLKVWYPITVATLSNEIRQVIGKSLALTGDPSLLPFKLHDFGYRGVSSDESSWIGGFAHLVNFMGTDTFGGIQLASRDYGHPIAGFSIPASEHSTITSWGGPEHEAEAMENMLMGRFLGRKLRKGETVHHRNGKRSDNRIENLELRFAGRHPRGLNIADLIHTLESVPGIHVQINPEAEILLKAA